MNAVNPALAAGENHESWAPLLQLAAQEVFDLMLGCPLTLPVRPLDDDKLDVTSMVGLAGQLCGIMSIRCRSNSAALMASKMLGIDAESAGPELWDALGEICNMIAGNFKNKISGLGDGCMLSVPTVITGADYSLHSLADAGGLRIAMLFEGQPVVIFLQIHS